MRILAILFTVGLSACSNAQTVTASESYSLLLKTDGQTWCGYRDLAEFQAEAMTLKPAESARVMYYDSKVAEVTYQVEAESGDWIVVDKYTLRDDAVTLRRANLLTQANLQVIQESLVQGDGADRFHVVSVSTLEGTKAELPPNVDFPEVPVRTNLTAAPFVQVADEMRKMSLAKLCKKTR